MVNWLFSVTCNEISAIYVTAHGCAGGLKKWDIWSGSQRHTHFVGFFNVSVQTPRRGRPFYYTVIPRKRYIKSPFATRWGYGGDILDLNLGVLTEVHNTCSNLESRYSVNRFNHASSWIAALTPTNHPKSVGNRCVIEDFCCIDVFSLCFLAFSAGTWVLS